MLKQRMPQTHQALMFSTPSRGEARYITKKSIYRSRLNPAIISSFAVQGFQAAFGQWPNGAAIDLYAFMHNDVALSGDAAKYLKSIAEDETDCRMAVSRINKALEACYCKETLVALSSFLPQISFPDPTHKNHRLAVDALVGLIRLAKALRHSGHPNLRIIELVSGTRIKGIWHGIWEGAKPHPSGKRETFFAFRDAGQDGPIQLLAETLKDVCKKAGLEDKDDIVLACELEPGPLNVLRDEDSLLTFIDAIDRHKLTRRVALNLDCAHWQLAQLASLHDSPLDKCRKIMGRVVHAHMSDHARGHFGDVPIGDLGFELQSNVPANARLEPFRRWLDLLAWAWFDPDELARRQGPAPSGYVSIELEACRGMDAVQKSLKVLRSLLAE